MNDIYLLILVITITIVAYLYLRKSHKELIQHLHFETIDILERAFEETPQTKQENLNLKTIQIGEIKLPTGRIVACDPGIPMDGEVFEQQVTPGEYPVQLAIAQRDGDQRIAYGRIQFTQEKAVNWEPAKYKNTNNEDYGVDTALGSFMDQQGRETLEENFQKDENYGEQYIDTMADTYEDTREWGIIDQGNTNIILFTSGYGDGVYKSYWGYDKEGQIATLTTDFNILPLQN